MPTTSIRITGNVTEALAALDHLGLKTEEVARKTEDKLGGAAKRTGGLFQKLGDAGAQWGIPFSSSLGRVGDKFSDTETKGKKFGAALAEVGKTALLAGTAGFAVIGVESVKMAGNFQSAAEHLVTDAGESQAALSMVEQGMLKISTATGTAANDVVNGMYHIESAGFHGAAGLTLLKAATEGAKVGGADLDTIAKTLTGTMNAFHVPASGAVTVMNQLIATVGAGDMRMQDLASSLGNVGPIAASAGIQLSEVGGAIATMTSQNMSAQQATQDLANLIRSLGAPSAEATHEMAQMGLDANFVSKNLGKYGLTGTLAQLTDAITSHMGPAGLVLSNAFNQSQGAAHDMQIELQNMAPATRKVADELLNGTMTVSQWRKAIKGMPVEQHTLANEFLGTYNQAHRFNDLLKSGSPEAQTYNAILAKMTGGATGLNTALMLSGGNMATFANNVRTVNDASKKGGQNVDNWGQIQQTFNQKLETAKVTVENLGIKLGLVLIPKVEATATAIMNVIGWFEKHKTVAKDLADVLMGVLGAAITAFVVNKVASLVSSISGAITTIGKMGDSLYKLALKYLGAGTAAGTMATETEVADAKVVVANDEAAASGGKLGGAMSKAGGSGLKGAGGLLAFGVAAGIGGKHLSNMLEKHDAFVKMMNDINGATDQLSHSLANNRDNMVATEKTWIAGQIESSGLGDKAARAGISVDRMATAVMGGRTSTLELIDAWKATGQPSQNTLAALALLEQQYYKTTGKVVDLATQMGKIPPAIKTGIFVNADGAFQVLSQFQDKLGNIVSLTGNGQLVNGKLKGMSAGGWVVGPGAGSSDSVTRRLAPSEYVLSDAMLRGSQPVDPGVKAAISGHSGGSASPATVAAPTAPNIQLTTNVQTNATAHDIAREQLWGLRAAGWTGA